MSENIKTIFDTIKQYSDVIYGKYQVKKIGIFGSYAKNRANIDSDIDFYVEFKNKSFDNIAGLWNFLEKTFDKKIDIIYPHKNSNKIILDNIKKETIYG